MAVLEIFTFGGKGVVHAVVHACMGGHRLVNYLNN